MKRIACLLMAAVWVSMMPMGPALAESEEGASAKKLDDDVIAGAYYFDGWRYRTDLLKAEFQEREPAWGWEDGSQEILDRQIELAVQGGLDFWAIDWYYPEHEGEPGWTDFTYETHPLNEALRFYMRSEKKGMLKFCLLVANHEPFRIFPKDWDEVCDAWVELFKDEQYLVVDGKPLLLMFSPREMENAFETTEKLREAYDTLQAKAKAAGLNGVWIAPCGPAASKELLEAGYNCFSAYHYRGQAGSMLGLGHGDSSTYEALVEKHEEIWDTFAKDPLAPYIPVATLGWDNRPRSPENHPTSPYFWFTEATPEQIEQHVSHAVKWMDGHPGATFDDRVLLIFSWNEIAEGAYMVPTKEDGTAHLDAVRRGLKGP